MSNASTCHALPMCLGCVICLHPNTPSHMCKYLESPLYMSPIHVVIAEEFGDCFSLHLSYVFRLHRRKPERHLWKCARLLHSASLCWSLALFLVFFFFFMFLGWVVLISEFCCMSKDNPIDSDPFPINIALSFNHINLIVLSCWSIFSFLKSWDLLAQRDILGIVFHAMSNGNRRNTVQPGCFHP